MLVLRLSVNSDKVSVLMENSEAGVETYGRCLYGLQDVFFSSSVTQLMDAVCMVSRHVFFFFCDPTYGHCMYGLQDMVSSVTQLTDACCLFVWSVDSVCMVSRT